MSRVNIYLPDDLAADAKATGLNVSQLAQDAIREALNKNRVSDWVAEVRKLPPSGVTHEQVIEALTLGREEFGATDAG